MRLIDAEAIDYDDYWYNKGFSIRDCKKAQQLIQEQLTVEERKQGKWIRNPSVNGLIDDFRCSCCNSNPPVMSVNISWGWNLTNYCPNCGADMRGSENE